MNRPMPKTRDYYELLGVPRGASQKDIQSAFRKLARKLHPDVNPGDQEAERRAPTASAAAASAAPPEKRPLHPPFRADRPRCGGGRPPPPPPPAPPPAAAAPAPPPQ